jgi:predicted phage tail component-like protein
MAANALFVNDFDCSSLGLVVADVDGHLHAPSSRDKTSQLPQRVGAVILAPEAETAPRTLVITGVLRRASVLSARNALLELQERLYRGTVELRFADDPDKVYYARVTEADWSGNPPQFVNPHGRVSIRATCFDPLVYDRYGSVIGFSSVRSAVPLGTAVSAPTLRIMGAATNPVVTYRDKSGTSKRTMSFTGTLAATDYLEIDGELFKITKYASGVASQGIALLTSGDFIALDPHDSDPASGVWGTLEVSAGTGECLYRRSWL